jgi:ATP-binding cassette subfamily F protein 3
MGYNVIQGFYAQHQLESLHVDNEILEELKQAGSGKTEQELRGILGCFLFSDEDQYKKIKVLSGGEKSRVALAKTLISEANFLLLDEPTNHLDFISENILIQALQQYQGSFVVVSHNRYFVSQVANKIWYIEDRQIKEYPGTYEEYDYWRKKREQDQRTIPGGAPQAPPVKKQVEKPREATGSSQTKTLQIELQKIEADIEEWSAKKNRLEQEMAKPEIYGNFETLAEIQRQFSDAERHVEALTASWEKVAIQLDEQS